jgi:hypothetical protein
MHGHFLSFLKNLDHEIKNEGDKLVITLKGDRDELVKLEKVLRAMKDLHEACDCDGEDCHGGCCC